MTTPTKLVYVYVLCRIRPALGQPYGARFKLACNPTATDEAIQAAWFEQYGKEWEAFAFLRIDRQPPAEDNAGDPKQ